MSLNDSLDYAWVPRPDWSEEKLRGLVLSDQGRELLRTWLGKLHEDGKSWDAIAAGMGYRNGRAVGAALRRFCVEKTELNEGYSLAAARYLAKAEFRQAAGAQTRAIKRMVTTSFDLVSRVWKVFSGKYLCLSPGPGPGLDSVYCRGLHIWGRPKKVEEDDYPLPRFTLELGPFGPSADEEIVHPISGYAQLMGNQLHLLGQTVWPPRGRLGLITFEDLNHTRRPRQVICGWALIPSVDLGPSVPEPLVAIRITEESRPRLPCGLRARADLDPSLHSGLKGLGPLRPAKSRNISLVV